MLTPPSGGVTSGVIWPFLSGPVTRNSAAADGIQPALERRPSAAGSVMSTKSARSENAIATGEVASGTLNWRPTRTTGTVEPTAAVFHETK